MHEIKNIFFQQDLRVYLDFFNKQVQVWLNLAETNNMLIMGKNNLYFQDILTEICLFFSRIKYPPVCADTEEYWILWSEAGMLSSNPMKQS